VSGAVAWTRTGLHLTQGERFDVRATGQVNFIQTASPVGPDGATDPHPGVCVLPGPDHHAALIGRILGPSADTPFLVGSTFDGQANLSGELELGINDIGVDNNAGSFHPSICSTASAAPQQFLRGAVGHTLGTNHSRTKSSTSCASAPATEPA